MLKVKKSTRKKNLSKRKISSVKLRERLDTKSSSPRFGGVQVSTGYVGLSLARTGHTVKIAKTINADDAKLAYSPALLAA